MLTKYRGFVFCFIFFLFFILSINFSYAEEEIQFNNLVEWNYGIVEKEPVEKSTEFFVDEDNTTLVVDHKNKEIRLYRENIRNPIQFIDEDNSPIAYSVMTERGILQFAFDGTEMIEIGSLKLSVENPLAMATKQNEPDLIVANNPSLNKDIKNGKWDSPSSKERAERSDYRIEYYGFNGFEMIGNPMLEIVGLKEVRAMGFLKDETAAILTNEALSFYGFDGSSMVEIPYLKFDNLDNPLDLASYGDYNILLLTEDKISHFSFSGAGLVEIPSLSVSLDSIDGVVDPRSIAVVDGMITFLDASKAYTFLHGSEQMHYVEALSVTEGLTNPMGISIHRNSHDIIILDKLEDKSVIKYYMFDGTKLVENKALSLELEDIILGTGGKYDLKGVLLSRPLAIKNNYVDIIQVGLYAHLEEDTSIKLFISNRYESEVGTDDEGVWKPIWNLVREKGDSQPTLYKNYSKTLAENWKVYEGGISELYPTSLDTSLGIDTSPKIEDYEVIEDEDGKLYLKPKEEDVRNKWFNVTIPLDDIDLSNDSYVKFKMEFYSKDGKKTPKVFVPSERNKVEGIKDDVAIRVLARRKPLVPIIDDIDPEVPSDDLPKTPDNVDSTFPEFPKPIAVSGWVYTTTPTITWQLPIIDDYKINDTYQMAYQVVVMAIKDRFYIPALITGIVTESIDRKDIELIREFKIPTSNNVNIEGPLYASGTYKFAVFVRVWDKEGNPSDFSMGKQFNVLAFERPRIERIESTPNGLMAIPTMINKGMEVEDLLEAKAGTAITFIVDVVGPVENDLKSEEDISIFYYTDKEGKNFVMEKGKKVALNGDNFDSEIKPTNRYKIITWTPAPVTANVENSIVKVYLYGDSSIGGRTVFTIPNYSEGVVRINNTVYEDWKVYLNGRDW